MQRRFKVVLTWDNEAQVYVVTVPALPGCLTQGKSRKEALERVQEAIAGHIEALKVIGQPVPQGDVEFAEVQVINHGNCRNYVEIH
ncbi:MAG: hypothetical protein A4E55_00258 [Pelotomaculum sp. PtaU1.Bin035]|nr:MAG: hypothetical protein A4E55_00258 [Pelotomaculum sp. PtaU1.Bin035]